MRLNKYESIDDNFDTAAGGSKETNTDDGYIDEPAEWDSASSSDGEDVLVENDSEIASISGSFSNVNQNRVTRSGRRITAAKHFMYDEDSGMYFMTYEYALMLTNFR